MLHRNMMDPESIISGSESTIVRRSNLHRPNQRWALGFHHHDVLETGVAHTRKSSPRPGTGDPLCFALKDDGEPLRLGRAIDNELVIAEPSVSRLHAQLEQWASEWYLVPLSQKRPTLLAGWVADPGERLKLASGAALELGGVKLSFYDSKDFKALVSKVPLRSSR